MGDSQEAGSRGRARILQAKQHELCLLLIQAVRERQLLYDSKRNDYRDTEAKSDAWEEVQKMTKMTSVQACQKLWKTLRDRYIRELRLLEKGNPNKKNNMTPWPYFDALGFYKNCGRAPRTYSRTVDKPRHSGGSLSSYEDSEDKPESAESQDLESSPDSPTSYDQFSALNLTSDSRDSTSYPVEAETSIQEVPESSGFKHEPSTSAFKQPIALTARKSRRSESSESPTEVASRDSGFSPEHKAFLNNVLNLVTRRDSEASRYGSASPERMSLHEEQFNAPFSVEGSCHLRSDNGETVWQPIGAALPGSVPSGDIENVARPALHSQEGAQVPENSEEALDLSSNLSVSRDLVHAPRAVLAVPAIRPLVAATAGGVVSNTPGCSYASPSVGDVSPSSSQEVSGPKSDPHLGLVCRKQHAVIESWPEKRVRLDDEDSLFALALIPALKRFSSHGKSRLKASIMQSLADAELKLTLKQE